MVRCAVPNRGTRPRFIRIKTQVLAHEGRELRDRLGSTAQALPAMAQALPEPDARGPQCHERLRNSPYYEARMFADPGSDAKLAVAAAQASAAVVLGRYETKLARFGKPGTAYVTDRHLVGSVHFAAGIALCQVAGCVDLTASPCTTEPAASDQQTHAALMEMSAAQ